MLGGMDPTIERFRRTMRRHERRARKLGAVKTAQDLRTLRMLAPTGYGTPAHFYLHAAKCHHNGARTRAFLMERAGDALTRLRAGAAS